MEKPAEIEKIQQAIRALEGQRQSLGDEVVETALAPLHARLASLQAGMLVEQRKLATVLFADLVGFTALSAQMDPEDMRELLNDYFDRCRRILAQYGGIVEKFIGDAIMAVFGLPRSGEDDPERAIRAGLEISQVLTEIEREPATRQGRSLAIRVGINTGEVVVGTLGERQENEFVVVGEAVNLASRLQTAAPPGGVLITQDTYRHVRGVFEVQPVAPLQLKGIPGLIQAYLVTAAKPRAFRLGRRGVEGVETSVVGREPELHLLKDAFSYVEQAHKLQVVTVVGEAGIGKSRLMAEFEEWLEMLPQTVYYFKGRAHPSMQTTPYSLVRDLFAFRFQIHDSDPPPIVRQKLEGGYAEALRFGVDQGESPEGRRANQKAAHYLGHLLGFEFGSSEHLHGAGLDARTLHDQAFVYLRDFFFSLGKANPLVVLLEDLHWSDDSSLDLIDQLQGSLGELPLLIVGAARPGLFERRPQWQNALPDHQRLDLGPLSRQDSRALVEQILHKVEHLPEHLVGLVVAAAEGNPFYIEELIKMLIEEGTIQTQEMVWQVELERLGEIRVPPTLMGVLQARFDSLSAEERSYLQRGSVIGRIFWDKAVEYLDEGGEETPVNRLSASRELPMKLQSREMIFERDSSTFADTCEYLFKHALLRDVTYESLLKRRRRGFHHQAARWLEQVTERSGRTDEFLTLIADHYERAEESASAAGWYWRAGQGAAHRFANAEAIHTLSRALELTPAADLERHYEIRLSREKVYELQGVNEGRLRDLEALQELAEKLGDTNRQAMAALRKASYSFSISDFPAVIVTAQKAGELALSAQNMEVAAESDLLRAHALNRQGAMEEAQKYARLSLERARQYGLSRVEANSLRQLGLIAYYKGEHHEARERFSEALALYSLIGDRQGEGMAINNLGGVSFELGDHQQAGIYYARSLALCREIGDLMGEGRALNNLGIIAVVQGEYARAEEFYLQGLRISREIGHRSFEMSALDNLGNLALYRYQFSRAKAYQLEARQGAHQLGDRVAESFALINLSRGCLMTGDYRSANTFIQAGLELLREIGDQQGECDQRINLSYYSLGTGAFEAARTQAEQALALSRKHGFQSEEAWALHLLGEAELASGNAQAAHSHFLAAMQLRRELKEVGEACDSQAGLAKASLSLGDLEQALVHVGGLVDYWEAQGALGLDQPVQDMLRCYQVLEAARDPRAPGMLERGYRLLLDCAANIEEEDLRRAFLEEVPGNKELLKVWKSSPPAAEFPPLEL
jgi:class 3 adenylate cyclase/tetratricopeptide (TPR) repeat protein